MTRLLACLGALFLLVLYGCAAPAGGSAGGFDLQAHRGGRGLAPENTLAAFSNAMALGVDTLELDIGLTADGIVVISHDTVLNPEHTRDAQGAFLGAPGPSIRSLTLAQLQRYDVGRLNAASNYGKQFPSQVPRDGERIPTLASLFEIARGSTVRFNIETKIDPTRPDETASAEAIVDALLQTIERAGMAHRVTVQSFDWRTLALVAQRAPNLPRAYLTSARTLRDGRWTGGLAASAFPSVPQLVKAAGGAGDITWSPSFGELTPEALREAHALGLKVLPWTVNQRADMVRLLDWGVDGLITDYPNLLREALREGGRQPPRPQAAGPTK